MLILQFYRISTLLIIYLECKKKIFGYKFALHPYLNNLQAQIGKLYLKLKFYNLYSEFEMDGVSLPIQLKTNN